MLFLKSYFLHMRPHINIRHISRMIPCRLAGHIVINDFAVDTKVLKTNIPYSSFLVISFDYRNCCPVAWPV